MRQTLLALACVAICGSVFTTAAQTKQPCTPSGGLSFVCGVENAEDLVVVPNSRWMVASYVESGVLASGWLLGEKLIAKRGALVDAKVGSGHVILFGFRPQYRAQSYQAFKLLFNAFVM